MNTVTEALFSTTKAVLPLNATGYPMPHEEVYHVPFTTFEERLEIENGLRENLAFGEITSCVADVMIFVRILRNKPVSSA